MKRKIEKIIKGYNTIDGDNVHLTRVLSRSTFEDFDPILMLDSFDSENYDDYKNGFSFHPHRGIITISYLDKGEISHRDSLRNEDSIVGGEVQWMVAGSGIMHEEIIKKTNKLLGAQIWINLPKTKKMVNPEYKKIRKEDIKKIFFEGGYLKLLIGSYKNYTSFKSELHPLDFYSISLEKDKSFNYKVDKTKTVIAFTLKNSIEVDGEVVDEKTAILLSNGDEISINALDKKAKVLLLISEKQNEKIAWAGPIVMSDEAELKNAFKELENNTFIKNSLSYK